MTKKSRRGSSGKIFCLLPRCVLQRVDIQDVINRGVEVVGVGTSTAGSHNAARRLPAGRSGGLCSMALLAPAGCNSGESGKIVLGPSPKISLQPYYAGKVSRVEFHLPHAAGRWGSDGSR